MLFSLSFKCQLCDRLDAFAPCLQFLAAAFKGGDIIKTGLDDAHTNNLDLVNIAIGGQASECVEHHLAIMVSVYKDTLPRLEITDMQQTFSVIIFSDDQHVRCPEPRRSDVAVIHPLLH